MTAHRIRQATADDLGRLDDALARLSADLGDPHRSGLADLGQAAFGERPSCHALVAEGAGASDSAPFLGISLFSPVYSTVHGSAGAYVSDLWVAPAARGLGLGRRMLAGVADEAGRLWGAAYLRLTAYDDRPTSLAFYARLGFVENARERHLALAGAAFQSLGERA